MAKKRYFDEQLLGIVADKCSAFQKSIMGWAAQHSRDYPWRRSEVTPYGVLIAEALLKRTTATAVVRVYEDFVKRFPTLQSLVAASEGELIDALSTIGLQKQRARSFKAMARYLLAEEVGEIPADLDRLQRVPGLGHYSARALLSFAYGMPAAVLDANVERVLRRVFLNGFERRQKQSSLQALADVLLPAANHRKYNLGLLDLGGLVCKYVDPKCGECPLNPICNYSRHACQQEDRLSPLRQLRRVRKMSQRELAKRAGTSKLTVIKIEAGRVIPQPKTLKRLADVLGVTPEVLREQKGDA